MKVNLNVVIFSSTNLFENNKRKLDNKKIQVLLCRQKDKLFFPAFDVDNTKNIYDIVKNKLEIILKTNEFYIEQLYTWGEKEYYTKDNEISISYMVIINEEKSNKIDNGYGWYKIDIEDLSESATNKIQKFYLYNEKFKYDFKVTTVREKNGISIRYLHSFDDDSILGLNHSIILVTALKRLRSNLNNTDLAYKFLPESFTLTELQQIHEVILDKKLDKGNFRKKVSGMLVSTEEKTNGSAHRPSAYFKLDPNWIKDYV
jgi:Uncharacterized conserved protein